MPSRNEFCALMKAEAGVTPARPEIAPLSAAVLDGFPARFHESPIQTRADVDEAICVTSKVFAASDPEARALPALNPNHPIQSSVAPMTARGMLWGTMISGPKFFLRPSISAAAREPRPALV